jgi:hypothetical protein
VNLASYRERRLLFILSGINAPYRDVGSGDKAPTADELNQLKAKAWDLLEAVRRAPQEAAKRVDPGLRSFLSAAQLGNAVFTNPDEFAAEHKQELAALFNAYSKELGQVLTDSSKPMWQEFQRATHGWDGRHRRSLLSRYVVFPLSDALIFLTIALSELPQFTPTGVTQYSPVATGALTSPKEGNSRAQAGIISAASWKLNGVKTTTYGDALTEPSSSCGHCGPPPIPRQRPNHCQPSRPGTGRRSCRATTCARTQQDPRRRSWPQPRHRATE